MLANQLEPMIAIGQTDPPRPPRETLPTISEQLNQEQQRAEQEWRRAEQLAAQLRALGIEPKL